MTQGGPLATQRFAFVAVCVLGAAVGCGPRAQSIKIDGSSTVYPISEAVAESFRGVRPDIRVTVGLSGTGGGMKKFTAGEIDICDASRGIKDSEVEALTEAEVPFTEFSVAFDGIAVVVHPENDWVDSLTVEQLASIWRPLDDAPVKKWNELNPAWPDEEIKLYGPGTDSGTFEYFTEAIVGEAKSCRSDFAASEDDNVLVTSVSEDKYSLGYFGFAYYAENTGKLKLLGVAQGEAEPVQPSVEAIRDNSYAPLSRPLFIYVRNDLLNRPAGAEFVEFYLDKAGEMAAEVGYVAVSDDVAAENLKKYQKALAK
ncbi:Phosphate-binding protein PstS precursor [Botrimarina colliarenosi]|uniref:Phosphate-binding protein n=1 Tax=Botrimarina colliarenosi TaxID=2528001 RepID=A0A5C6A6P1_9BACT|nr:PstS family phosphate ABC transporter substrate-binding protein [Botrimarina colliarenosi]TWT94741.1 Phosphate-binding protein PstS precursor [Botrimarina colliarenosi]